MHKYIQLTINTSKSCYIVEGNSRNLFASIFLDVHWYFWNYASILITIFSQFNCYCSCYSNQENLIIILPHCYVETQENYCHKSYTSHLFVERRYSLHLLRENVSPYANLEVYIAKCFQIRKRTILICSTDWSDMLILAYKEIVFARRYSKSRNRNVKKRSANPFIFSFTITIVKTPFVFHLFPSRHLLFTFTVYSPHNIPSFRYSYL